MGKMKKGKPSGLGTIKKGRDKAFGPKVTKAKSVRTPSKPYG